MHRSAREKDIWYFSVICCALKFSLKDFMTNLTATKHCYCTNQILWALLFVIYTTYLHKICSSILAPWRGHFQGFASLIWCPEPLSFNYGSHSLTERQYSSWGHHDVQIHLNAYVCVPHNFQLLNQPVFR
jgi:hypothetical protein